MNITAVRNDRTLLFAAEELRKYLEKISVQGEIALGLYSDFDGVTKEENEEIDSFLIDIETGKYEQRILNKHQ